MTAVSQYKLGHYTVRADRLNSSVGPAAADVSRNDSRPMRHGLTLPKLALPSQERGQLSSSRKARCKVKQVGCQQAEEP